MDLHVTYESEIKGKIKIKFKNQIKVFNRHLNIYKNTFEKKL